MKNQKSRQFIEVSRYIFRNIDTNLSVENIAKQIQISLSALKRLFEEAVGLSPGKFIRRIRMEYAFRSLQNREDSILEVALACGFEDPSAFARSFKENFGFTPRVARKKINILSEYECVELEEPELIELTDLHLQAVTMQGTYFESAPRAWIKLRSKLNSVELSDDFEGLFIGIGHDNPHDGAVTEDEVRFSACVSNIARDMGIEKLRIPGGQYARFYYEGKPHNLGLAYHYIYGQWCEKSKLKLNPDKLSFIVRSNFPEGLQACSVMIYVPLL